MTSKVPEKVLVLFKGGPADGLSLQSYDTADELLGGSTSWNLAQMAMTYYDIAANGKGCLLHPAYVAGWLTEEQRQAFFDNRPLRMHVYRQSDVRLDGDVHVMKLTHDGPYDPKQDSR